MKAFLSHSSKDKDYVEKVAKLLRPGTYELDSLTFEKGEMNVSQIISSLNRVDLFCLFLSESSALSKYVDFEQKLAIELVGAGKIKNFLTLCLDEASFSMLASDAKFFNAIRRPLSPETAAHFITGKLISAQQAKLERGHPFVGRDIEMKDLENQILDFSKPRTKGWAEQQLRSSFTRDTFLMWCGRIPSLILRPTPGSTKFSDKSLLRFTRHWE
jgi:hypothetical protein